MMSSVAAPRKKKLKIKLLPHEQELLANGALRDVTHTGASSIWLEAGSTMPALGKTTVYRPMGDEEICYLVKHNQLPDTQPYQAIIEGPAGREYAEKYLSGRKWVDTCPTTVVEFTAPAELIAILYEMQHKPEDGVMSIGLGHKAGGGLPLFNQSIADGDTTWRIVKVKRAPSQRQSRR